MAKKKEEGVVAIIKKLLGKKGLVMGTERTMKLLKQGKLKTIYLSSNVPENLRKDVEHYSNLNKVEVVNLKQPNEELGVMCKKPFAISMLSVTKWLK